MELWDLFDRGGSIVKTNHVRGEVIPEGTYHKIVNIIVKHIDGDYLIMKRSDDKESRAGEYELTAGGSTIKGEDFREGAWRELYEETGIKADILHELTPVIIREEKRFLQQNFFCLTNVDKNAIQLQAGETQGFQWLSEDEVLAISNTDSLVRLSNEVIERIKQIKFKHYDLT